MFSCWFSFLYFWFFFFVFWYKGHNEKSNTTVWFFHHCLYKKDMISPWQLSTHHPPSLSHPPLHWSAFHIYFIREREREMAPCAVLSRGGMLPVPDVGGRESSWRKLIHTRRSINISKPKVKLFLFQSSLLWFFFAFCFVRKSSTKCSFFCWMDMFWENEKHYFSGDKETIKNTRHFRLFCNQLNSIRHVTYLYELPQAQN